MAMHIGYVGIETMPSALFYAVFLILSLNSLILCNASFLSSNVSCMESERQALLSFKHDLQDPSKLLASWASEDCCNWYGVVCSKTTGHVHKLLLGDPHDQFHPRLSGEINPALVELKFLRHLDLSNTNIGGARIPKFLGSLRSLRHLNVSGTSFSGMIPHQLGNLTNLHSLDLSFLSFEGYHDVTRGFPHAKNLQWLSQLSSLQYLDMSGVDLQETSDWVEVINLFPSLIVLRLRFCNLSFNLAPIHHVNFSSLSLLDLSRNDLWNYSFPSWVSNLRRLTSLHLSEMSFGGPIFEGIQNLTSLVHLDLFSNFFNASIPNWLYSLSHLEVLNLGNNRLRSTISSEIKNLTSIATLDLSFTNQLEGPLPTSSMAHLCKLKEIDLSGNKWNQSISQILDDWSGCLSDSLQFLNIGNGHIYDHLTNQIGHFKALTHLYLHSNSISGPIPASFKNLTSLRSLALSDNQLVGTLPDSLGQFVNLEELSIDNNRMEGVVSQAHFANTSRLNYFSASGNSFHLKVGRDWAPPFQLKSLDIGSWQLGTRFPLWIKSQTNLNSLGLFNTGLQGVLPSWFSNFSSELYYLNLCHNQLHGRILDMTNMKTASQIFLSQNHFEGPLPSISSKVRELDLSDNQFSGSISQFVCNTPNKTMSMEVLNLAKNLLVGKLPNCWSKWKHVSVLRLSYNQFSGSIPFSFARMNFLTSLHLSSNHLYGTSSLSSLQNSSYLITLDLSQNKFGGNIPAWIGTSLSELRILSVVFNKFYGHIPNELCALNFLQIMDLSNNNLSGPIPKCFNNFSNMATTNANEHYFSYHRERPLYPFYIEIALLVMKGKPLEYNRTLGFVNIIDLSNNSLSGNIPLEITSLSNLVSLNLSNNHLEGEIPTKIGNMSALESIDFSMNRLSGEIPPSMASMNFLSHLNLSFNNLSGHIPTGTQLQSFDSSSFFGNHLCGPPLTVSCITNGETTTAVEKNNKEDDNEMMWWFYVGMPFGFVAGFWGVFGFLVLNRTQRHAYFLFLDNVKDRIHVVAVLKLGRLRALLTSLFSQ